MSKLEEIAIPDSAYAVKAWFSTAPGDEIRREIKAFIRAGNEPYLWHGHTHTKPPINSFPVYLDEFDLPEKDRIAGNHAPCPCCTPRHPKYAKGGKIAWFPDEGVIRLIGPDCFRALSPEGHDRATAALRVEQRRRKEVAFLSANVHRVPEALRAIEIVLPWAAAIDGFGTRLRALTPINRLFSNTRGGSLQITVKEMENVTSRVGETRFREVDRLRDYAPLRGRRMIDPRAAPLASRLLSAQQHLFEVAGVTNSVADWTDDARRVGVKNFSRGLTMAREVFNEIEEARRFLEAETLATLRTWGRHDGALFPFYIARDGDMLRVGAGAASADEIAIPTKAIDLPLPRLPEIATELDDSL